MIQLPLALLLALPQGKTAPTTLVTDVTVVDVERGVLVPDRTLRIAGERIVSVTPAGEPLPDVPADAHVIAGEGLYVMPGLSDMHVHYVHPESFGPLFLANGVTFVRDTGADTETIVALRDELAAGDATGPEMICTGAIVDGPQPFWPFSEACATPEDGMRAVAKLAEAGVDQIKVYTGLPPDVFRVVVEEAHRRGLPVTGHVPMDVPLEVAFEVGMDCNEHLTGFGIELHELENGAFTGEGMARFAIDWSDGWLAHAELPDEPLDRLAERAVASGMVQSPTLIVMERISRLKDPALREDPLLEYVPKFLLDAWSPERDFRFQRLTDDDIAKQRRAHMQARTLLHRLWVKGARIVSGTDLANPFLVAGFSLLEELELYAACGLPPAAVLRTTTIEAAKLAGRLDSQGTVEAGKTASLILLSRNPLEDVSHLRSLEGVFLRGRFMDRAALDGLLERAREAASGN